MVWDFYGSGPLMLSDRGLRMALLRVQDRYHRHEARTRAMTKREAGQQAQAFMDRYAIGVRELAEWIGVPKSSAGDLVTGQGYAPVVTRFQKMLAEPRSAPIDAWTDELRAQLRHELRLLNSHDGQDFERATAVHLDTARRAAQPNSRPTRPVRRLLRQWIDQNNKYVVLGEFPE